MNSHLMSSHSRTIARPLTVVLGILALVAAATGAAVAQDAEMHERRAKPAVVRDGDVWFLNGATDSGYADEKYDYGSDDTMHVMGDWDGDGVRTPAVIRVGEDADGNGSRDMIWYLRNSNSSGSADEVVRYGEVRNLEDFDTPIVGDWDGDGDETVGVVRPDYGNDSFRWLLNNDNDGDADLAFDYGHPRNYGTHDPRQVREYPVVGDWDGDGTTTVGTVRRDPPESGNRWKLRNVNDTGPAHIVFDYGLSTDQLVTGDWDGDGTVNPGIIRDGNHWFIRNSNESGYADESFRYGSASDKPLVWK